MKKSNILLLTLALMLFTGAASAQDDSGKKLTTSLAGSAEVPGPGDTDGSGSVTIRLNQGQKQVCFELSVSKIATATAAHIHRGAEGVAGDVVVTLTAPANGKSKGCVDNVAEDLIKEIRQSPETFYVNVHNAEFADGAVRGQLGKKMETMEKPKTDKN